MTYPPLSSVLDLDELQQMLDSRYVRMQRHPQLPLRIYNYTQAAQYSKAWNAVTLACRGLVVDDTDRVIARPFAKFFNAAEHDLATLPSGPVEVTDKLDGSLGILVPVPDGHVIATRGSFTSDQAVHATKVWQERYAAVFTPDPALTYLFEIVYPQGRIVVDYAGMDDLVLLGAVHTATGGSIPLARAREGWPGPVAATFDFATVHQALAAPARAGVEGYVVHFLDTGMRVKVKMEEYVRLHRLIFGISERRIWEALSTGVDVSQWLEAVPDEFFAFVTRTQEQLTARVADLDADVHRAWQRIIASLPADHVRADFARAVAQEDRTIRTCLFSKLDGRDYQHVLWQAVRPAEAADPVLADA